ncbi:hypothetical protein GQ53DRAFT_758056 [Thozetella sp. PMI_491]|nr:hypothetical protein GQ53DRAFT_758056 [Thozetella sp. PMI_491]
MGPEIHVKEYLTLVIKYETAGRVKAICLEGSVRSPVALIAGRVAEGTRARPMRSAFLGRVAEVAAHAHGLRTAADGRGGGNGDKVSLIDNAYTSPSCVSWKAPREGQFAKFAGESRWVGRWDEGDGH